MSRWAADGLVAPVLLAVQTAVGGVAYLGLLWLVERQLVSAALDRVSGRRSRSR